MRKGNGRYSSTTEKNIHGTVSNDSGIHQQRIHDSLMLALQVSPFSTILPTTSEQFISRSSILGRGVRLEEIDEARIIPLSSIEWERVELDLVSSPDAKNESR